MILITKCQQSKLQKILVTLVSLQNLEIWFKYPTKYSIYLNIPAIKKYVLFGSGGSFCSCIFVSTK